MPQAVAGAVFQVVHVAAKFEQPFQRLFAQDGRQHGIEQAAEHAQFVQRSKFAQLAQGGVANAPARRGDGTQKRRVVVVVAPQAKPGAQIFDLGPVEKTGAARNLVRNARLAQRFLERLGLVVGAVEDGKVLPRRGRVAGRFQGQNAGHGAFGLVLFGVAGLHAHGFALAQFAEQGFGKQLGVGANHMVGRAQDGAGGAVVLLQLDDLQLREVLRQAFQVVQRGPAPAVNALVIVAHGGKAGGLAHQQLEQGVLRGVGVLVFIHQHMAQQLLPFFAHLGVVVQQPHGHADKVVKIDALVGGEALFVALHDDGQAALVVVLGQGQRLAGIEALVLPRADAPLPLPRCGRIGGATGAVFQDAGDIVGIQNAEVGFEPQHMAIFAHHAHPQGVKGADQHLFGFAANQPAGAFAHLGGGLVGKGDGGNAPGGQAGVDQVGNLVRNHPRFARARPRQHQAGAINKVHGLELGAIQTRHNNKTIPREKPNRAW